MNYIEVNGAGLRYELSGAGAQTLVLVHEMGGTLESWDHVLPRLAGTRRILRYDTRGAGMSQKIRGDLSIDTMNSILAWRDQYGIADTQTGGVSGGIYRGLNIGTGSADDPALVAENRRRVAEWLGVPKSTVTVMSGTTARVKVLAIAGDTGTLGAALTRRMRDFD